MMPDADRVGRYYLKQRGPTWYICWTDDRGTPHRRSARTVDIETARRELALFAFRQRHGATEHDAATEQWSKFATQIVARKAIESRKRKLPFDLDAGYVLGLMTRTAFRCPVSGIPFAWSPDPLVKRDPWSPSIDRIDARHGYVKGNVRIVSLAANVAMNNWGYDVLLRLAHGVMANHYAVVSPGEMVGASGIEPPTTTMSRWCSTTELRASESCQPLDSQIGTA